MPPFLEAYRVVADSLVAWEPGRDVDDAIFLDGCLALGRQYVLQHRIRSEESVSMTLFETALKLAANRGLVNGDDADLVKRRRAFAVQLRDVLRRVDAIEAMATARRAGIVV